MKNKKTLINTIIGVFAITFLVGAAYAFAPGILDVRGTVNIAVPDYVVWTNVEGGDNFHFGPGIIPDPPDYDGGPGEGVEPVIGFTPFGAEFGATHNAIIVDARGRTNQLIEWNIYFYQGGFADITATVTNQSALHAAIITNMNISWGDEDFANTFGDSLTVRNFTGSFVGTTLAPGESTTVYLAVDWDGTVPDGFVASNDDYTFVNTFLVEFDYELAH